MEELLPIASWEKKGFLDRHIYERYYGISVPANGQTKLEGIDANTMHGFIAIRNRKVWGGYDLYFVSYGTVVSVTKHAAYSIQISVVSPDEDFYYIKNSSNQDLNVDYTLINVAI